ncbi:MAG: hypothetical protein KW804_02720 [Candidatus Doudnabacteria bacterium]|nr:hypothetical protein [Candidatus Doudnabacteria bacterium]
MVAIIFAFAWLYERPTQIKPEHIVFLVIVALFCIWIYYRRSDFTKQIAEKNGWKYSMARSEKTGSRALFETGQEDFVIKGSHNDIPFELYTGAISIVIEIPGEYKVDNFSIHLKSILPIKKAENGWIKTEMESTKLKEIFVSYRPERYAKEKFVIPSSISEPLFVFGKKYHFNFYIENNKLVYSTYGLGWYNTAEEKEKSLKRFIERAYEIRKLFI